VRNERPFIYKIIKNNITIAHKETIEAAEAVMKELFDIKDYWDVNRIKCEARQKRVNK